MNRRPPDRFDSKNNQEDPFPPPDVWPANLWIALGALIYAGAPQYYDSTAAAAYFFLGGGFALIVLGTTTARFNKIMAPILLDLFPGDGPGGRLLPKAVHWLTLGMEGLAVMHLSRLSIVGLARLFQ